MSGIPLEFQPWLQPDHIPDSLWNYQAPTLNEWEVDRNWDWATKPASEYVTEEEKAAKAAAAVVRDGGRDGDDPNGGSLASGFQHWDDWAEESEQPTTAFTMNDLMAMSRAAAESAAKAEATMGMANAEANSQMGIGTPAIGHPDQPD